MHRTTSLITLLRSQYSHMTLEGVTESAALSHRCNTTDCGYNNHQRIDVTSGEKSV